MSDEVVFEEEQANTVGNISIVPGAPTGMLRWLVKNKIAESAKQGEQFMLGIAVVAIVLAIGVYILWGNTNAPHQSPEQIQTMAAQMNARLHTTSQ